MNCRGENQGSIVLSICRSSCPKLCLSVKLKARSSVWFCSSKWLSWGYVGNFSPSNERFLWMVASGHFQAVSTWFFRIFKTSLRMVLQDRTSWKERSPTFWKTSTFVSLLCLLQWLSMCFFLTNPKWMACGVAREGVASCLHPAAETVAAATCFIFVDFYSLVAHVHIQAWQHFFMYIIT